MARIVITGASGFLGWNLARSLRDDHDVWGTFCGNLVEIDGCRMERLDLASGAGAAALVRKASPEIIIHAAAMIDVDLCDRERGLARRVNEEGSRLMAELAADGGARFIYFSTDMVFDGHKGMYTEADETRPINYYGETKRAGEKWTLRHCPSALVMRVSLIYGKGNGVHESFLFRMLERLRKGETVPVFTDQFRTPTWVNDICAAVGTAVGKGNMKGMYHISGPERLSRHEMGRCIGEEFGFPDRCFRPLEMGQLEGFLPRPKDISLDNRKAVRDFGLRFTGFRDGLKAVKREYDRDALEP